MPPDDCFYLEIWSQWHYNKKSQKFKTILISRSSRKMTRDKNLLILYYLQKKLPKLSNAQKKVSHALSFQLCSTANPEFSFYILLCEINSIKTETVSLVSKCIYFRRDSLCFIYFDVIICQQLKKKVQASWTFFSQTNEIKTCSFVQQLILGILRDLILQLGDF